MFENNTTSVDAKLTAFELATRAKTAGSSPNKKQKKTPNRCLLKWCRRRDLNPHGFPHTPLKRARIPIPSRRHISIIVFNCQISFSLCDGSCFLETTLSKNDTQSFFSAECHVDISRLLYLIVNFRLVSVTEVVSLKQPSRKTIRYVISWSLALNGSAVICFINCIYAANKPSPSARSRSAECHSTIKLSILSTA